MRLRWWAPAAAPAEEEVKPPVPTTVGATFGRVDATLSDQSWLPAPPVWVPEVPKAPPAVACWDLGKRFGDGDGAVEALRDVTVAFAAGTFSAIMGPSGSGKSTLMHLLAGLDVPTSGSVEIAGIGLDGLDDGDLTRLRRTHVGFVFQAFNLLPVLSAEDNVLLPLRIAGVQADDEWVDMVLAACGLADRRGHRPAELSGGQQQRLAIARALVTRPAIVFADEPTGNLDSEASDDVLTLLRSVVDDFDQTVVLVTHDPLAAARTDRVVFLADGRLVREQRQPSADAIIAALRRR